MKTIQIVSQVKSNKIKEKVKVKTITYVAEKVLKVVASGIVVGVQHSGVHVLFLMVSLPVVELSRTNKYLLQ